MLLMRVVAGCSAVSGRWGRCLPSTSSLGDGCNRRPISITAVRNARGDEGTEKAIIVKGYAFAQVPPDLRNKGTFHTALGLFLQNNSQRRGHTEFIYAALKHLKAFGLHKDLDTYKALLRIFPMNGRLRANNFWQRIIISHPAQNICCVALLDTLEYHGAPVDKELHDLVVTIFGDWAMASKKVKRMMYWMPKLRHQNPYLDRRNIEFKQLSSSEIARFAIRMICRDPATSISEWLTDELQEVQDKTWIVSGQSPMQQRLIERHPVRKPLYVDGPYRVYMMEHVVSYFTLVTDPDPLKNHDLITKLGGEKRLTAEELRNWKTRWNSAMSDERRALMAETTMHEQREETIFACAATGTSSKESATAWITLLQRTNPRLANYSVIFRQRNIASDIVRRDGVRTAADNEGSGQEEERVAES